MHYDDRSDEDSGYKDTISTYIKQAARVRIAPASGLGGRHRLENIA